MFGSTDDLEPSLDLALPLEPRPLVIKSTSDAAAPTVADPLSTPKSSPPRDGSIYGSKDAQVPAPSSPSPTPKRATLNSEDQDSAGSWVVQTVRNNRGLGRNSGAELAAPETSTSCTTPSLTTAASRGHGRGEGRSGAEPSENRLFVSPQYHRPAFTAVQQAPPPATTIESPILETSGHPPSSPPPILGFSELTARSKSTARTVGVDHREGSVPSVAPQTLEE